MDTSTIRTMENAAAALGSATRHIGAASLEIGRVVAPAAKSALDGIPRSVNETIGQARYGQTPQERRHAAAVLGVGVATVSLLAVATFAHFARKVRRSRIVRDQKRQVAAALKREHAIEDALARAVAIRPVSALDKDAAGEDLSFADACGCYVILTYDSRDAADDPAAFRDVYVGCASSMLEGVRGQLDGQGNLYVHADMSYGLPMYVAFYPCDEDQVAAMRSDLVKTLGADASYNKVSDRPEAD